MISELINTLALQLLVALLTTCHVHVHGAGMYMYTYMYRVRSLCGFESRKRNFSQSGNRNNRARSEVGDPSRPPYFPAATVKKLSSALCLGVTFSQSIAHLQMRQTS